MLRYWTINAEKLSGGSTWRVDIIQAKSEAQATQFVTYILTVQTTELCEELQSCGLRVVNGRIAQPFERGLG